MRRRPVARDATNLSLFPFLAVLVSTMGMLVVLLVLAVKAAESDHDDAAGQADSTAVQCREELETALAVEKFRFAALQQARPDVLQRLRTQLDYRQHLEAEIGRLRDRGEHLQQQWEDLSDPSMEATASDHLRAEKLLLSQQIQQLADEMANKRNQQQPPMVSYAIIPHAGRHGTLRRPIYIECTADALILQPSGIRLLASDFTHPVVPGNPLDAVLLALRQHWARSNELGADSDSYPLLIVRPDGAGAFALAREAMKSWDDQFGYELVPAEMVIDFGAVDPRTDQIIRRAIDLAKERQAALLVATESRELSRGAQQSRRATAISPSRANSGSADRHGAASNGDRNGTADNDRPPFGIGTTRTSPASQTDLERSSQARATVDSPRHVMPGGNELFASTGEAGQSPLASASTASLAARRGANWALPTRTPGASPYYRPVRIACHPELLTIYPGQYSNMPPIEVPMTGLTRDAVDPLVDAIWRLVETWGIAGINGYWKPVLRMTVAPGAEQRYAELKTLLASSGLEVEEEPLP